MQSLTKIIVAACIIIINVKFDNAKGRATQGWPDGKRFVTIITKMWEVSSFGGHANLFQKGEGFNPVCVYVAVGSNPVN